MKNERFCGIEGCHGFIYNRNPPLCQKHYRRNKKYDSPLFTKYREQVGKMPAERLWFNVAITANPDKCWEWKGSGGKYGRFRFNGVHYVAHRLALELHLGRKIDQCVLHSCDNPPCCNPNHLREGTALDNSNDKFERGRDNTRSKTHCVKGHSYTPENTEWKQGKYRRCRTCHKEWNRKWLHREQGVQQ